MLSQDSQSFQHLSVKQLRAPCDESMRALMSSLEVACKRLNLPQTLAATAVSHDWSWEPIASKTLVNAFHRFNSLAALLTEAQRVRPYQGAQEGDATTHLIVDRQLLFLSQQLSQDFLSHLSQVENPLGVLTTLLHHPELRITSSCVSALLGLRDERVGGEELRHTGAERKAFYARGGYMYQASDLFELGPIFSALRLKSGITLYDLGSGYGHVLFCGAASRRDITFKGIELMPARVAECDAAKNRLGLTNVSFKAGDVTAGGFTDADVLFLFNPFPPDTQSQVTDLIDQLALQKPIAIIDYGGYVTERLLSVVPIAGVELAPYHLVASKKFLDEACNLVGMPVPASRTTIRSKGGRGRGQGKSA